jgi:hypothetical protein
MSPGQRRGRADERPDLDTAAGAASSMEKPPADHCQSPTLPAGHPMERASESDRRWFEAHPGETTLIRARVEGEFGPSEFAVPIEAQWVVVEEIAPGLRTRRPLVVLGPEEAA